MRIDQSDITLTEEEDRLDREGGDENADPVIVIFRRWGKMNGGGVIALFPTIPTDEAGWYCQAYEHVGQHGGADYHGVVAQTKPALLNEPDVQDLKTELEGRGYILIVHRRWQPSREPRERIAPVLAGARA